MNVNMVDPEVAYLPDPAEDWIASHVNEHHLMCDTVARRMFMTSWNDLHPIAHEFQRKIVLDMIEDIIRVVIGDKK